MTTQADDPNFGSDVLFCVFQWHAIQDDFKLIGAAVLQTEAEQLAAAQNARDPDKPKCRIMPLRLIWEAEAV